MQNIFQQPLFKFFLPQKEEDDALRDRHPDSYRMIGEYRKDIDRVMQLRSVVDYLEEFPDMAAYYALGHEHPRIQHDFAFAEAVQYLRSAIAMTDSDISDFSLIALEARGLLRAIFMTLVSIRHDKTIVDDLSTMADPVIRVLEREDPVWLKNIYDVWANEMKKSQ